MSLIHTFYAAFFADVIEPFSQQADQRFLKDDLHYLFERTEHEGDSFVCSRLPLLGKAVEYAYTTDTPLEVPLGFELCGTTRLPKLFNTLFKRVFGPDGQPLATPTSVLELNLEQRKTWLRGCAYTLRCLRQLTLAFSKVEDQGPGPEYDSKAVAEFSQRIAARPQLRITASETTAIAELLNSVLLADNGELAAPLAQWISNPFGAHGPGAVAERERGSEKWLMNNIPGLDKSIFNWCPGRDVYIIEPADVDGLSRICIVPKDFSARRIICIEPKEFQFAQQGLWRVLKLLIESHHVAGRSINFSDQRWNQRMCKKLHYATIDLKNASDLVSLDLCRLIMAPKAFHALTRYRSRQVRLPDGGRLDYRSFATMGSALCFPVETLVFWAIARSIVPLRHGVRVFGDDIIVPVKYADRVMDLLERCGLVVNRKKTCTGVTFVRESCGAWKFYGFDAEIVKFHYRSCASAKAWTSITQDSLLIGEYFFSTHLASSIRSSTNEWYWEYLDKSGALKKLCDYAVKGGNQSCPMVERWNSDLHRLEVLVPVLSRGPSARTLPGYQGLYAWTVGNDTRPSPSGTEKVKWEWAEAKLFRG